MIVEQNQTFKFLLDLDKDVNEVRRRVMGTKPFPNPQGAFVEVKREESRMKVMVGFQTPIQNLDASVLVNQGPPVNNYHNESCQIKRKTMVRPISKVRTSQRKLLVGSPLNQTMTRKDVHMPISLGKKILILSDSSSSIKEQIEALQGLFSQNLLIQSMPSSGTRMLAQVDNFLQAFIVSNNKHHWIIDSGVLDHMTEDRTLF